MKLAMVGAGYVGLVTAACFAEMGNEVTCVDADAAKVEALEQGIIPIYEPGLEDYVRRNTQESRLFFTTDLATAVQRSLIVFIAVGTPQDRDGSADLSMVLQVARDIGRHMNGYKVIVEKSTVPVGTAILVRQVIQEELQARGEEIEFDVVSNPEFLKEGTGLDDFMKPDRIVGALCSLCTHQPPGYPHGRGLRGVDQVRGQCLSGHQDLLYQRTGQYLQPHRRQYHHGAPGHRLRPPYRPSLPFPGIGIWRLLFPQRYAGSDSYRQVPGL
jgi:hypothetical protein